ncbi:MAG: type II toxin-antitoxin system HicB family antitoxin [Synergistaceae bacterium]|jgi:predicted RNase H-like HicB family nuclease|nr:type II toxin-antitoxin system HicB family antitoxin [Synergistaceae bacterium]
MKYIYTAVFSENNDGYVVEFPDLPGCHTCGDTLNQAVNMARDALCLWLYDMEERKTEIPPASYPNALSTSADDFLLAISVDTDEYRRYFENKLVKKTLTIPS